MTLREKVSSKLSETRAVSPVIGVILMVAITVILAAVIGTFVMGLGNSVNQNAQAGVSFIQNNSTGVDVQLISLGNVNNPEDMYVNGCSKDHLKFGGVGGFVKINDCSTNQSITVLANMSGSENVVATHRVN
jgi:archaeal type IV pilus assembly protein PilA